MPDVDVERHSHEGLGCRWRARMGLHPSAPRASPLLTRHARRDVVHPTPVAPTVGERRHRGLERLGRVLAPRPLLVGALSDLRALQDQRDGPLGMSGSKEHCERAALGLAHDRSALASERVQERSDVVHALLERGRAGHAVGHAHSPLVEEDQPRELAQPLAVAAELWKLPEHLEVRDRALDVDEIDGSVADDAVGDVDITAAREADLGHATSIERAHLCPKECGRGSDSHTVSSAATRRASGPSDSSDETRTLRFSPTRS